MIAIEHSIVAARWPGWSATSLDIAASTPLVRMALGLPVVADTTIVTVETTTAPPPTTTKTNLDLIPST